MESNNYVFTALRGYQAGREYYLIMCPLKIVPKLFAFQLDVLPASLRDEVQEMINDLERCEQLLQVLNGIDSINNCLDCGSVEVIPFDTHNASIYHFNCGGQLKFRMSEIWVRFAKKTKTLIPKTE